MYSNMDVIIREFTPDDLEPATDLYLRVFAAPPWNETWHPHMARARLLQIARTPNNRGLAMLGSEGEMLGFALGFIEPWKEGWEYYLKEMCIAPERQRQGLGSRLMRELGTRLAAEGIDRIYLLTARGDLSEAFYTKLGFYTSPKTILMSLRLK